MPNSHLKEARIFKNREQKLKGRIFFLNAGPGGQEGKETRTCNHFASDADLVGWLGPFDEPGFFFFFCCASASRRALRFFFSAIIHKGKGGREDLGRSTPCCHRESARLLRSQHKTARVMLRRPFQRAAGSKDQIDLNLRYYFGFLPHIKMKYL